MLVVSWEWVAPGWRCSVMALFLIVHTADVDAGNDDNAAAQAQIQQMKQELATLHTQLEAAGGRWRLDGAALCVDQWMVLTRAERKATSCASQADHLQEELRDARSQLADSQQKVHVFNFAIVSCDRLETPLRMCIRSSISTLRYLPPAKMLVLCVTVCSHSVVPAVDSNSSSWRNVGGQSCLCVQVPIVERVGGVVTVPLLCVSP